MLPPPPLSTLFPYTTLFRSPYTRGLLASRPGGDRARRLKAIDGSVPGIDASSPRVYGCCGSRKIERTGPCSRSEEHTSELQSHSDLVCRLLLEKKKRRSLCI